MDVRTSEIKYNNCCNRHIVISRLFCFILAIRAPEIKKNKCGPGIWYFSVTQASSNLIMHDVIVMLCTGLLRHHWLEQHCLVNIDACKTYARNICFISHLFYFSGTELLKQNNAKRSIYFIFCFISCYMCARPYNH